MSSKTEPKAAYKLAVVLLIVGILCYAFGAFSSPTSKEPVRLMFKTVAGKVLFDHKTHADTSGYALGCMDCHHNLYEGDDASSVESCGSCHDPELEYESPKRADAFHLQCIGCHKDIEAGPEKCSSCHVM